jgi:hypothetical protein
LIFFLFIILFVSFNSNSIIIAQKTISLNSNSDSIFNQIKCITKEKNNPESKDDPIIIITCEWRKYKFINTGQPDYKGRYSYKYELFLIDKWQTKKVNNSVLFNDKLDQLENLINDKFKRDFDDYVKSAETSECFKGRTFTKFDINEMGISLTEDNKIEFKVSFGLGSACLNVDLMSASFKLTDIKEYLK